MNFVSKYIFPASGAICLLLALSFFFAPDGLSSAIELLQVIAGGVFLIGMLIVVGVYKILHNLNK